MIDLDTEIELYKAKVDFYEGQNTRGEYNVTVRELKYVIETLKEVRTELQACRETMEHSKTAKMITFLSKNHREIIPMS